jgi:hypothetical protein
VANLASLREAELKVEKLEELLPICMYCKKVRRSGQSPAEQESWFAIEEYVTEKTEATLSHGLCPHCLKEHYPDKAEAILASIEKAENKE